MTEKRKLQPITIRTPEQTGHKIEFVQANREPDEKPIVLKETSTLEEYDKIDEENQLIEDTRYWLE